MGSSVFRVERWGTTPRETSGRYYPGRIRASAAALRGPAETVRYDGMSKRPQTETELHG